MDPLELLVMRITWNQADAADDARLQGNIMNSHRSLFCAYVASLLAACGGGESFEPVEMPAARIQGYWQTTDLQRTYEIRTDAEWQAAWAAHSPRTTPPMQRPQVDFSQQMIVGLTFGSGPDGCHGISIRRVVEEAETVRVEYQRSPEPHSQRLLLCTLAIVPLTDFAVIRRTEKPAVFVQVPIS